jgi:cytidylate kinase
MSKATGQKPSDMDLAARERMERWLLSPELREHMQVAGDVRKPAQTGPYISVSRQAGAGGEHIARVVGRKLGWDVLDKELLDLMTQRYHMPRDMLDFVDETEANWFYDVLGAFAGSRIVSQDSYVVHLERIIYLAALHGNVVIVGRGAHCVLPRTSGLAVRIVAPKRRRVEEMMERSRLTRDEATLRVDELDKGRNGFCRRHFHRDIEDPLEYDLLVNTARLSAEAAAELIVDAFRRTDRDRKASTTIPI